MFAWLKYFPIAFSRGRGYVVPSGPFVKRKSKTYWDIGNGSSFYFEAPPTNSVYGSGRNVFRPEDYMDSSASLLELSLNVYQSHIDPEQRWMYRNFLQRDWFFVGPWFTGKRATLSMYASVLSPNKNKYDNSFSLLHPRAFEYFVCEYLNSCYGHIKVGSDPMYRGPVNWQTLDISPTIKAAIFELHEIGNTSVDNPEIRKQIFFPISEDRMVFITLRLDGSPMGDMLLDMNPLLNLANSIIESFSLALGESLEQEWRKIDRANPEIKLSHSLPELSWPVGRKRETESLSLDSLRNTSA